MAKISIIEREKKRERTVAKYAAKRDELKRKLRDPNTSEEELEEARKKFNALPRNAIPCR